MMLLFKRRTDADHYTMGFYFLLKSVKMPFFYSIVCEYTMIRDENAEREHLVQQVKAWPPGTALILSNEHTESTLMYLSDHFPISSPIIFQYTIPEQTIKNIAKYMIERRRQSPNPNFTIMIDPQSSASQAAYLVKAFKSSEFVLYMALSLNVSVLHSVVKGLGIGQGIVLDDDLPENTLQSTVPLIPNETFLYLSERMQEETIAIIAQLVPPTVRVSFHAQNLPLHLANTLAMNARAGCYLFVSQAIIPIKIAQSLASHINDKAILYCASGDASYMRAIASSLKAGGILVFHPSLSFGDVLQALPYMHDGTVLSLDHELDETQIELFVNAINKDVGILFNEFLVSEETRNQIMDKLASKKLNGTPESTQTILSVFSFISSETKRISDLNKAKAANFFAAQLHPDGPFHSALESIMQNTAMDHYEITQYFFDKFSGASVVYNPSLENVVRDYGFRFLVSFEDELQNITEAKELSGEVVDSSKTILTNQLKQLEEHIMFMSINMLGLD